MTAVHREATAPHAVARLPEEWRAFLAERGERAFRAKEIFAWIHRRSVLDPAAMSSLPSGLRQLLVEEQVHTVATVDQVHRAFDGTRKVLCRMSDGAPIETVLIPRVSGPGAAKSSPVEPLGDADASEDDEGEIPGEVGVDELGTERVSQCVSTQVGCAMGCTFCASGVAGLKRNLRADEIVAQVILGQALLAANERLTNLVYMGMGEPLHNYGSLRRSLELLMHPEGRGMSPRRITVSTSGLVPEIARLGADFGGQVGLAVSLHSAFDEGRSELMPINRKYPLAMLRQALAEYPLPSRRRITIEYTLIEGKNDSDEHAKALVRFLSGIRAKVNLIPMNPIAASNLGPSDVPRIVSFQNRLIAANLSCFVRRRRGDDVSAACGQLALFGATPKVKGFRKPSSP